MKVINASIDLTKIDKSKINNHQNGAKYYNITIYLNDEPNKFGQNVSIATSISKEERESGVKQTYIGNGKTVYNNDQKPQQQSEIPLSQQHNSNYDPNLGF